MLKLSLALLFVIAQAPSPVELLNQYQCAGKAPTGEYQLTLDIVQHEANYYLVWHEPRGIVSKGFGLRVGDNLSVIYQFPNGAVGLITYTISAKTLTGIWSMGDGVTYTESCSPGGTPRPTVQPTGVRA